MREIFFMELKFGMLTGMACVIWRAFEFYMGWPDKTFGQYSAYIGILLLATGTYMGVREIRSINNGILFFGKSFYSGMVICFVVALMMGINAYVFNSVVDTNRKEKMVAQFQNEMIKQKKSPEEIKQVEENARAYFSPMGQVTAESGGTMIAGLFVSLVISAFVRSKKSTTS